MTIKNTSFFFQSVRNMFLKSIMSVPLPAMSCFSWFSYLIMFARVAIIVAIEAIEVPTVMVSLMLMPFLAFDGTTISQPGLGFDLLPTLLTVPFIYMI